MQLASEAQTYARAASEGAGQHEPRALPLMNLQILSFQLAHRDHNHHYRDGLCCWELQPCQATSVFSSHASPRTTSGDLYCLVPTRLLCRSFFSLGDGSVREELQCTWSRVLAALQSKEVQRMQGVLEWPCSMEPGGTAPPKSITRTSLHRRASSNLAQTWEKPAAKNRIGGASSFPALACVGGAPWPTQTFM